MNSIVLESTAEPLTFNWESPRGEKLAVTIFLALSVAAHALCFYIFQIVYPPTVALLPPPARITLITPATEEGRTLLRWIESEDPALAFTTRRPPDAEPRALPKAEHVPSYSVLEPMLKDIPPFQPDLRIPSCRPPGAVRVVREKTVATTGILMTSVSLSKELDKLGAPVVPEPDFAASNDETPRTIRFRVGVNELGEVRYCFALNSSGDPALDEQARSYLARCRFARNTASRDKPDLVLSWGIATIEWGNDIARPQQQSAASVTP